MYNDRQGGYGNRQTGYGDRQGGYGRTNQWDSRSKATPQSIAAEPLPEDYVKQAENAIIALKNDGRFPITTSKLRSLFSLFTETYNTVARGDQEKLDRKQVNDLNSAKVRIYYEIGRDDYYKSDDLDSCSVGRFVHRSKLLAYLGDIGDSCEKLKQFYHYMEALVAFHRYYFGEKKDRN